MKPQTDLRVSSLAQLFPWQNQMPRPTISHEPYSQQKIAATRWIFGATIAVFALAFATHANAQQPSAGSAYVPSGKPSPYHYAPPDVQSPPQNGYVAPQAQEDQQPQYQPQYSPPQAPPQTQPQPQPQVDQQPQYQPQYAPPDVQSPPQNGSAQPQYQPQAPPQAQQDQRPQYAQPYAPQYAPQQPYADQAPNTALPQPYAQPDDSQAAGPVQALSAENLEQLLAPIALYPDALLAQILAASTYPAQVAVADQWVQQMRAAGYSSPDQIASGANAQTNWDPSIKALTAFPDVLDMLNHDLEWTSNLGNAYYNQPQDVMQTVQVLRDRAEQAGNLQSTPQEEVNNDQGNIELEPTNPQFVYVPTYNPWDVYGEPIAPYPGFAFVGALGNFFGGIPIQYGLCFGLAAFDRLPFGWLAWGLDWAGHGLLFNHSGYYTHSRQVADWGLPRGGPRAYYGRGENGATRGGQYGSNGQYRSDQRSGYNQGGANQRGADQRGGWSNNRGGSQSPGQSYVRPAQGFPEPGRLNYSSRDYSNRDYSNRASQQPDNSYTRPAMPGQQMYNRTPQQNYGYRSQTYTNQSYPNRAQTYTNPGYSSRPQNYGNQTYSNPGYRYGYTGPAANPYSGNGYTRNSYSAPQTYTARPGFTYANPSQSYRAPQSNRSYQNYGNTMARNERSGGFSSQRAPSYTYKAPSNYGGGHQNFGGGHQNFGGGHQSAPKMSHSSGGGGGRRR
jgi:hypothetical protein